MAERVVEIIVHVMSTLKQKKKINEKYINELKNKGYNSTEISAALSWIAEKESSDKLNMKTADNEPRSSYRLLHENEKEVFTPEAHGLVIQYQSLGLLDSHHIEMMIERSFLFGFQKIQAWQVKAFVAALFHNQQHDSRGGYGKFMLSGNELIN